MNSKTRKILFTGVADDIEKVLLQLETSSFEIVRLTESFISLPLPQAMEQIIFVVSHDTFTSSQLRLKFNDANQKVAAKEKFLLLLDDGIRKDCFFPEVSDVPRISIDELRALLAAQG